MQIDAACDDNKMSWFGIRTSRPTGARSDGFQKIGKLDLRSDVNCHAGRREDKLITPSSFNVQRFFDAATANG